MDRLSAFVKPEWSSKDHIQNNPPQYHVSAYVTGGLQDVFNRIQKGTSSQQTTVQKIISKGDQFCPYDGHVLAKRYRLTGKLSSQGQFAVIVGAKDTFCSERPVIIKVMHKSFYSIGLQEVHCLWRLAVADPCNFSQTVHLLNTFTFNGHLCLVFEFLHPTPITDVFEDFNLPNSQLIKNIRKVAFQLLKVLGFLQRHNTIHADIKPENILLQNVNDLSSLKVIDFGNSIHHTLKEVSLYYHDFEVQTLLYRAPEVMFGIPFGTEVDMWSLGCVLAELYLGESLFCGTNKDEILHSMTELLGWFPASIFRRGKFFEKYQSVTSRNAQPDATMYIMQRLRGSRNYAFANFLAELLRYDPDERLTPSQALRHSFLAPEFSLDNFIPDNNTFALPNCIDINPRSYKLSPKILAELKRQNPSTFDLLKMGTRSNESNSKIAKVCPFELNSSEKQSPQSSGQNVQLATQSGPALIEHQITIEIDSNEPASHSEENSSETDGVENMASPLASNADEEKFKPSVPHADKMKNLMSVPVKIKPMLAKCEQLKDLKSSESQEDMKPPASETKKMKPVDQNSERINSLATEKTKPENLELHSEYTAVKSARSTSDMSSDAARLKNIMSMISQEQDRVEDMMEVKESHERTDFKTQMKRKKHQSNLSWPENKKRKNNSNSHFLCEYASGSSDNDLDDNPEQHERCDDGSVISKAQLQNKYSEKSSTAHKSPSRVNSKPNIISPCISNPARKMEPVKEASANNSVKSLVENKQPVDCNNKCRSHVNQNQRYQIMKSRNYDELVPNNRRYFSVTKTAKRKLLFTRALTDKKCRSTSARNCKLRMKKKVSSQESLDTQTEIASNRTEKDYDPYEIIITPDKTGKDTKKKKKSEKTPRKRSSITDSKCVGGSQNVHRQTNRNNSSAVKLTRKRQVEILETNRRELDRAFRKYNNMKDISPVRYLPSTRMMERPEPHAPQKTTTSNISEQCMNQKSIQTNTGELGVDVQNRLNSSQLEDKLIQPEPVQIPSKQKKKQLQQSKDDKISDSPKNRRDSSAISTETFKRMLKECKVQLQKRNRVSVTGENHSQNDAVKLPAVHSEVKTAHQQTSGETEVVSGDISCRYTHSRNKKVVKQVHRKVTEEKEKEEQFKNEIKVSHQKEAKRSNQHTAILLDSDDCEDIILLQF